MARGDKNPDKGFDHARRGVARRTPSARPAPPQVSEHILAFLSASPAAELAVRLLRQQPGAKVYVVGGAVRDAVIDRPCNDVDLVVCGLGYERVKAALRPHGAVKEAGNNFKVLFFAHAGEEVEIALPRIDVSTGEGYTDFEPVYDPTLSIEDDLLRRDYRVNAMAWSLDEQCIVDPFGGQEDADANTLRLVREEALEEDPLRSIRALVLIARFGLDPDEHILATLPKYAERLALIPGDRKRKELIKILKAPDPVRAIRLGMELGLMEHFLPEVAATRGFDQRNPHHADTLDEHLLHVFARTVERTPDDDDASVALRLAALVHDVGKPASQWIDEDGVGRYYEGPEGQGANHWTVGAQMMRERLGIDGLQASNQLIDDVYAYVDGHMFGEFKSSKGARRFLNRYGDYAEGLLTLRWADQGGKGGDSGKQADAAIKNMMDLVAQARAAGVPTDRSQLAVNGRDLIAAGIKPGPGMGAILDKLVDRMLDDPDTNTRESMLAYAQRLAIA